MMVKLMRLRFLREGKGDEVVERRSGEIGGGDSDEWREGEVFEGDKGLELVEDEDENKVPKVEEVGWGKETGGCWKLEELGTK